MKLGILGCGRFGEKRILPAAKQIRGLTVAAIQRRNEKEGERIAQTWGIPNYFADPEELLKCPEIEAVWIASPNHLHEPHALAAADAHKPALCEKPLAPTVESASRILKAFRQKNVPLLVGQSMRFKWCVQKAKALLEEGLLGDLKHIRVHFSIPGPKSDWRYHPDCGGGVLQDIGVHLIDLIHFISSENILSVQAQGSRAAEVDTTVHALLALKSASASLSASFDYPFYSGFEVIGSRARLVSQHSLRQTYDPGETLALIASDESQYLFPLRAHNIYEEELKHFIDVVQQGAPPLVSPEEGLRNIAVIEALYQAMDLKKVIILPESY